MTRWGDAASYGFGPRQARVFLGLLLVSLVVRLVASVRLPLATQEAYYWMYAQHPALSYFDHPPAIAWAIGLGCWLLGDSELGVRLLAAPLMLLSSWLLYRLAAFWVSREAGVVAAIALQLLPFYYGMGLIHTMNAVLFASWLGCLLALSHALERDWKPGWYLAGALGGVALLSKYSAVLLGVGTLAALLTHPRWRRHLVTPHPWLAAGVALLVFSPVIVWNWQHDWASLRYQFYARYEGAGFAWKWVGRSLGLQVVLLTPVPLAFLLWWTRRSLRGARWRAPAPAFALAFSVVLLGLFAYRTFTYSIHLDWTTPMYFGALPPLAGAYLAWVRWARIHGRRSGWAVALRATAWVCVAANTVGLLVVIGMVDAGAKVAKLGPWDPMISVLEELEARIVRETGRPPIFVGDDSYSIASILAFYGPGGPERTTSEWLVRDDLPEYRAGLMYGYWHDREPWIGRDVVFVADDPSGVDAIPGWFEALDRIEDPRLEHPQTFHVAIGRGLRAARRR